SNAPVTLVASCERDREDRHTPHRTYRPRSSSPMGRGEAEGTRRTASLALDEASVVGEGRTEPTVEVEAGPFPEGSKATGRDEVGIESDLRHDQPPTSLQDAMKPTQRLFAVGDLPENARKVGGVEGSIVIRQP